MARKSRRTFSQPFEAGVITFLNGTSDLTSLIFGASLKLYDNFVSDATYLGTDTVIITTTSNLGTALAQDADYINICGNGSNICGSSIEAYEDLQGGTGVTAVLMGQIVGDPQLQFTDVALAAVQTNLLDPASPPGFTGLVGDQAAAWRYSRAVDLGDDGARVRRDGPCRLPNKARRLARPLLKAGPSERRPQISGPVPALRRGRSR